MRCFPQVGKILSVLLLPLSLSGAPSETSECSTGKEIRRKTLLTLDRSLELLLPAPFRSFPKSPPETSYTLVDPALQDFERDFGFFSCNTPLVGVVTEEESDLEPIQQVLLSLSKRPSIDLVELAVNELLCKAVAYRNLRIGTRLSIPCRIEETLVLVDYIVDNVLNLWQGMPAFGLLASENKAPPILLFRGSDFSLLSKKSWASLVSDLDVTGTGFTTFRLAENTIRSWLEHAYAVSGQKAKTGGFSLGGVLAVYTFVFARDVIASEGSFAFNIPGLSKTVAEKRKTIASGQDVYVRDGDWISHVGLLPPPSSVAFTDTVPPPIEAHVELFCARDRFSLALVNEIPLSP